MPTQAKEGETMDLRNKLYDLMVEYADKDLTDKAIYHAYEHFYPEELSKYQNTVTQQLRH